MTTATAVAGVGAVPSTPWVVVVEEVMLRQHTTVEVVDGGLMMGLLRLMYPAGKAEGVGECIHLLPVLVVELTAVGVELAAVGVELAAVGVEEVEVILVEGVGEKEKF